MQEETLGQNAYNPKMMEADMAQAIGLAGTADELKLQRAKLAEALTTQKSRNNPTAPPPFLGASLEEKIDRLRTVGLDLGRRVQELELQQGVQDQRLHRIEEAFLNHRHSGAEGLAVIPATSVIGWTSAPRLKKEPSLLD